MKSTLRAAALALGLAALSAPVAEAAEPDKVVVRNRKHTADGKLEVTAGAGFTLVDYLTSHTNLGLGLGYNFAEEWAVEVGGGYSLSRHTNVAVAASEEVVRADPQTQQKVVNDFEDLWQMVWNASGVVRWEPVYGKVNVAAELPLHFKAYLLAGGGVAGMKRDSLVYCIGKAPSSRKTATCSADPEDPAVNLTPLHDQGVKPLFIGGGGLKLYLTDLVGLRLEVRDVAFLDSYREDIQRSVAENDVSARDGGDAKAQVGKPAANPGLTHLVFMQVGAAFSF